MSFDALEQRVMSTIMQDEHVKMYNHQVRQVGKSRLLGMMYGAGPKGFRQASDPYSIPRTHPLEFDSHYNFAGREAQFGNVPVYKVTTKLTSEIICRKQKIPHTCVHYRMLDDLSSWVDPTVAALVWTRATPTDQLETAVATSLMMGHTPVLLRAFDKP